MLALGADLKNAITLVVDGQAFVSQHIGDLDALPGRSGRSSETIDDLLAMYDVERDELLVGARRAPPVSLDRVRARARRRASSARCSTTAPTSPRCWPSGAPGARRVLGVSLDGTGYGDDGTHLGRRAVRRAASTDGFERVAHLRQAALAGGDAAARHPVQAAAGFLAQLDDLPDLDRAPFEFPERYAKARRLLAAGTRVFPTTSAGRLFDTAAALLGFTRAITFEGQAAIWLEQLARTAPARSSRIRCPFDRTASSTGGRCSRAVVDDRLRGRDRARDRARVPRRAGARALRDAAALCRDARHRHGRRVSGGVFQNAAAARASWRRGWTALGSSSGPITPSRRTTAASAWDRPRLAPSGSDRCTSSRSR